MSQEKKLSFFIHPEPCFWNSKAMIENFAIFFLENKNKKSGVLIHCTVTYTTEDSVIYSDIYSSKPLTISYGYVFGAILFLIRLYDKLILRKTMIQLLNASCCDNVINESIQRQVIRKQLNNQFVIQLLFESNINDNGVPKNKKLRIWHSIVSNSNLNHISKN